MQITGVTAAPLIRHIIAYKVTPLTNWHGSHYLKHKKVIIANDAYAENPCSCWWIIIKKPASPGDIILKELKGVILTHLGGHIASAGGDVFGQAHEIHGHASKLSRGSVVSKSARQKAAGGMANQLDQAWRSGTWDKAKGTQNEFGVGMDYFIAGGAAFFKDEGPSVKIGLMTYRMKQDFLTLFTQATVESNRSQAKGIQYTRHIATGLGSRTFRYTPNPGTLE